MMVNFQRKTFLAKFTYNFQTLNLERIGTKQEMTAEFT